VAFRVKIVKPRVNHQPFAARSRSAPRVGVSRKKRKKIIFMKHSSFFTYNRRKGSNVKRYLLLMIVALVLAPLLVAGCTSTSNPSPSPSPATVNVTTTSATSSASPTARTSTTSPSASLGAQTITISGFSFQPSALTIQRGASVTWRNDASVAHQIVSNTGAFSSSVLNPGDSYAHQFSQPGTYAYHCGIHPFMTGTITVQ